MNQPTISKKASPPDWKGFAIMIAFLGVFALVVLYATTTKKNNSSIHSSSVSKQRMLEAEMNENQNNLLPAPTFEEATPEEKAKAIANQKEELNEKIRHGLVNIEKEIEKGNIRVYPSGSLIQHFSKTDKPLSLIFATRTNISKIIVMAPPGVVGKIYVDGKQYNTNGVFLGQSLFVQKITIDFDAIDSLEIYRSQPA